MKGVDNTTNVYLMGFYMLVMAVLFLALVAMLLFLMVWKSLEKTQVSMEEEQPHRSSLKHVLRMKEESYISLYKITESETHFEKMETEDTLLHLKRIRSML